MLASLVLTASIVIGAPPARAQDAFIIRVVDEETGRGVPLVELRTVNEIRLYTDSAGIVAFHEPGLMNADVHFRVASHGYEFPADGFGIRGRQLHTAAGGRAELKIARKNIAERLYRVTGEGIYRDSLLVGEALKHAFLEPNALVLGSDSVVQAFYRGRLYWFWGDTSRASYVLGNFNVPGAVSSLPADGGLSPNDGVALDYFKNKDGFAAETCRMPGEGPTWIQGLTVLKTKDGGERLYAGYMKIRKQLEVYARGIARFDDEKNAFEQVLTFPKDATAYPQGHPFQWKAGDDEYVLFADPFPLVRTSANETDFLNLANYESFTCLLPGATIDEPRIDRDERGRPRYAWRKNAVPMNVGNQRKLIESGAIKAGEGLIQLRDVATGKPVSAHAGSMAWNAWLGKWMLITAEIGGSSFLGETWFAESDTPLGPWCYARKIVTHEKYSFYNPRHHPHFDEEGGRRIYFEGTYTHTFSGNEHATPRYDYNQIMYRLDLADERLSLPAPVYVSPVDGDSQVFVRRDQVDRAAPLPPIAFFALDRPTEKAVPVFARIEGNRQELSLAADEREATPPLFYALSVDAKEPPASAAGLYVYRSPAGVAFYTTDADVNREGWKHDTEPLCLVWRNPWSIHPWGESK